MNINVGIFFYLQTWSPNAHDFLCKGVKYKMFLRKDAKGRQRTIIALIICVTDYMCVYFLLIQS